MHVPTANACTFSSKQSENLRTTDNLLERVVHRLTANVRLIV